MILKSLTPDILELLQEIENLGFSLCLVGGAVRDYLLTKEMGKDLDFEIRASNNLMSPEEWEQFYKKLPLLFGQKKLQFTSHPYLITTVNYHGYDLEFSSPRLETAIDGNTTHHHFTAKLDTRLNYKESFKRRDFTINAIGVELEITNHKEKLIDPFEGLKDINSRLLRHIDEYFFEDSVRFLRLIRFSLCKKDFTIYTGTLHDLNRFNLSGLSPFHLKRELLKSQKAAAFLNRFRELIQHAHLSLNPSMLVLIRYDLPVPLITIEQVIGYLVIEHEKEAREIGKLLSLPEKILKDGKSFLQSFRNLQSYDFSTLKKYLLNGLGDTQTQALLKDIKNLQDKKEWIFLTEYLKPSIINWKDFVAKKNPVPEEGMLKSLPGPQRSLLEIYLKLQMEL